MLVAKWFRLAAGTSVLSIADGSPAVRLFDWVNFELAGLAAVLAALLPTSATELGLAAAASDVAATVQIVAVVATFGILETDVLVPSFATVTETAFLAVAAILETAQRCTYPASLRSLPPSEALSAAGSESEEEQTLWLQPL